MIKLFGVHKPLMKCYIPRTRTSRTIYGTKWLALEHHKYKYSEVVFSKFEVIKCHFVTSLWDISMNNNKKRIQKNLIKEMNKWIYKMETKKTTKKTIDLPNGTLECLRCYGFSEWSDSFKLDSMTLQVMWNLTVCIYKNDVRMFGANCVYHCFQFECVSFVLFRFVLCCMIWNLPYIYFGFKL